MFHVPAELQSTPTRIAATTWLGVEFIYAKVGAGKSHHVVKDRILPALREGRNVFTNVDFGGPLVVGESVVLTTEERAGLLFSIYLRKDVRHLFHVIDANFVRSNLRLSEGQTEFSGLPPGSRVILDEVQNICDRDGYSEPWRKPFFRFLCVCRHYDVDFVFISQNPALVDGRILSTSSKIIRIKNGGFMSSLFSKGYRLTFHQSLTDWEGYGSSLHKFDPDIFLLYKSSDSIVKHQFKLVPTFLVVPLVGILLWVGYMAYKLPGAEIWGHKRAVEISTSKSVTTPSAPVAPVIPPVVQNIELRSPAAQAVEQLLAMAEEPQYRNSPISVTRSSMTNEFTNAYIPLKPYKPLIVDGVETFTNTVR